MNKVFLILAIMAVACDDDKGPVTPPAPPKIVLIGDQTWNGRNLDVEVFANGALIPQATTDQEWSAAANKQTPAWCYYDEDPANGEAFGKLYNWYAVADPRGLCPSGWHVPSDEEWSQLEEFLGGSEVAGAKLKSAKLWLINGNGPDEYEWSGVPGGIRNSAGAFAAINMTGAWWSSSENFQSAWNRYMYHESENVARYSLSKASGMSVRCVKD